MADQSDDFESPAKSKKSLNIHRIEQKQSGTIRDTPENKKGQRKKIIKINEK